MRKKLILSMIGLSFTLSAQMGKIGIATQTPTENLDVEGSVRVRNLPKKGVNKIYTADVNVVSDSKDQTYTPVSYVAVDTNGVLGLAHMPEGFIDQEEVIEGANDWTTADNDSDAPMVIRRYKVGDYPSGVRRISTLPIKHLGFSTDKWEAILFRTRVIRPSRSTGGARAFGYGSNATKVYQVTIEMVPFVDTADGKSYLTFGGDVTDISEVWDITVLYINKKYLASDGTTKIQYNASNSTLPNLTN